jgi:hypothetical protein
MRAAWTAIKFHETQLHFSYAQHRQADAQGSQELVAQLQDKVSQTARRNNDFFCLKTVQRYCGARFQEAVSTHLPQPIRKFRVGRSLWAAPVVHACRAPCRAPPARITEQPCHEIQDCVGTLLR